METPIWVYEAALLTLEAARQLVEAQMAAIRHALGVQGPNQEPGIVRRVMLEPKRHGMSAEGRAAIAQAQRKRWAKYHKAKKAG